MKKIVLSFLIIASARVSAQETPTPKTNTDTVGRAQPKNRQEVGVNITLLANAIWGNNNLGSQMQPYQLTYKFIRKDRWALRAGFGMNISNTSTNNSMDGDAMVEPPDALLPNYFDSQNYYGRLGGEYRWTINRAFRAYAGIDLITSSQMSSSQTNSMVNDLPYDYSYSLTQTHLTGSSAGIGPVLGIQWFCSRRISLLTEVPIYYTASSRTTRNYHFKNELPTGQTYYNVTMSNSFSTTKATSFTIALPVTLYLCVKF